MKMWCTLVRQHRPAAVQVYNSGYWFSHCARCGTPLVRSSGGGWRPAPSGHRIVWKAGRHCHSIEADYARVLPVALPSASLPALPGRFGAWRRDLVPLGRAPVAPRAAMLPEEAEAEALRCPRLLLLAVMIGAGLKMVLTLGAER